MRKISVLFVSALCLIACGNKKSPTTDPPKDSIQPPVTSSYITDSLLGEYIGGFGNNTIVISVNYINGQNASGYNILKGNRRNIKGTVENKGARFHFMLEEPGGDPYDGTFDFTIDTTTRTLEGTWTAFDSAKVKPKKYKLARRKYNHDEMDGFVGHWYLNDLSVNLKADKSGVAEGMWYNEKTDSYERVEIPCSWFGDDKLLSIEWGKNNIFLTPKMKFTYEKNQYEEMLISGDYIMYRY